LKLIYLRIFMIWNSFCGLLFAGEAPATRIQVQVSVEPLVVHIGDLVNYSIRVSAPQGTTLDFPEFGSNLAGFFIKEFSPLQVTQKGDLQIWQQTYQLSTFLTGDYFIPPVEFTLGNSDKILSAAQYVRVDSRLKGSSDQDIRDIFPPRKDPNEISLLSWLRFLWAPLILFILIIAGVSWFKRREHVQETLKLDPWVDALQKIETLKKSDFLEKGQMKVYFTQLSDILRNFLENRYGLVAPERTTEEFFQMIRLNPLFSDTQKQQLASFLKECDLVKFARLAPEKSSGEQSLIWVSELIKASIPQSENEEDFK